MPGNQQSFTHWLGGDDPGSGADKYGMLGPAPVFRNEKDRQLAAWGTSPDTQHPDGYLGSAATNSRQAGKMSPVIRTNTRSYTRGVHKGERVNPGDYVWPDEFNPMSGVENQATTGMRFPTGTIGAAPVKLTNDGKAGPRGIPSGLERDQQETIDLQRRSMLKTLLPHWR